MVFPKHAKVSHILFAAGLVLLVADIYVGYKVGTAGETMPAWWESTIGKVDTIGPIPTWAALMGAGAVTHFGFHK